MDSLVGDFQDINQKFIGIINKFPEDQRDKKMFNKWSLKDVVAHISAWNLWTIEQLRYVKLGGLSEWDGIDAFNKRAVKVRSRWTWDEVFKEFIESKNALIKAFKNVPESLWKKDVVFSDEKATKEHWTLQKILKEAVNHYKYEHLPELRKVINEH